MQERKFRCEVFADPLYGSEQHLTFEPEWVAEAENTKKGLLFRRAVPVTRITFTNGETHVVHGHWADQIKAAQAALKNKTPD